MPRYHILLHRRLVSFERVAVTVEASTLSLAENMAIADARNGKFTWAPFEMRNASKVGDPYIESTEEVVDIPVFPDIRGPGGR